MTRFLRLTHSLWLITLVGCSSLAPLLSTPTPAPRPEATSTPQSAPSLAAPTADRSKILRVWLPPQFDPTAETQPAVLLNQRLNEFESQHPGLELEIRIKGADESSEMVNILSVTNGAAPAVMPDLIALTYNQMQSAASAGFLHPLDGLTDILRDPDWYAFARELGSVQSTGYGIPFAADALMTVYRPSVFDTPPSSWDSIINSGAKMAFPASDPRNYFPLSLYLSINGQFADEQGAFALEEAALVRVLSLYQRAYEADVFPINIRDVQTDAQSINNYLNGDTDLAVVWASSDIGIYSGGYMPLLGLEDIPYSIGNGWVWAFAGTNPENQPLAIELASHLVESEYMSGWTYASGFLPTRPLALEGWDGDMKDSIDDILHAAHPIPSPEVISKFGPLMQEALVRIFNGDQAEVVARNIIEGLE